MDKRRKGDSYCQHSGFLYDTLYKDVKECHPTVAEELGKKRPCMVIGDDVNNNEGLASLNMHIHVFNPNYWALYMAAASELNIIFKQCAQLHRSRPRRRSNELNYIRAVRYLSRTSTPFKRLKALRKMKKARTEMRKEGQDDFSSHVKVLRNVSAGPRSRSRHVRPLQSLRL